MIRRIGLIALVFAVAACGSDDDGGNAPDAAPTADAGPADAPPRSTELDPICNATDGLYVDLFSRFFECNPFLVVLVGDVEDQQLSDFCYASFQPFIDDGTVTLTANTAACRAYVSTDCQLFDIDVADCDDVFVGAVAVGSDCEISEQCTPGNYCTDPASGCGSCQATLGKGRRALTTTNAPRATARPPEAARQRATPAMRAGLTRTVSVKPSATKATPTSASRQFPSTLAIRAIRPTSSTAVSPSVASSAPTRLSSARLKSMSAWLATLLIRAVTQSRSSGATTELAPSRPRPLRGRHARSV